MLPINNAPWAMFTGSIDLYPLKPIAGEGEEAAAAAAAAKEKIILGYWGIRGLGAAPRILCAFAGADWVREDYNDDVKWFETDKPALQAKNPLANLPCVCVMDVVVLSSSMSWAVVVFFVVVFLGFMVGRSGGRGCAVWLARSCSSPCAHSSLVLASPTPARLCPCCPDSLICFYSCVCSVLSGTSSAATTS